jgi:hypothetical protein
VSGFKVSEFQGFKDRNSGYGSVPCIDEKRVPEQSAPFFFYNSIISISPACWDKLCVFISPTDSLGYAENCRNGGLDRVSPKARGAAGVLSVNDSMTMSAPTPE